MTDDGAVAICRRLDTGEGQSHIDRAGGDFWLYRLHGTAKTDTTSQRLPAVAEMTRADADTLSRVYRTGLELLFLSRAYHMKTNTKGYRPQKATMPGEQASRPTTR
jgi:hypothetical protein